MPKPKDGAPPVSTALPSLVRISAFASSRMMPLAAPTLGSSTTCVEVSSGNGGVSACVPWNEMSAPLPLTTASVFA